MGGWGLGHLLAIPTSETTIKADKEHWTIVIFRHQQRKAAGLCILLLADCNGHEVGMALWRRQWVAGLDGHCTGALIPDMHAHLEFLPQGRHAVALSMGRGGDKTRKEPPLRVYIWPG